MTIATGMSRNLCTLMALCMLLFASPPTAAQDIDSLPGAERLQRALPRAPRLPRAAFLEARTLGAVRLSPAGDHVAYLREQKDARSLWLLPTSGGSARRLVASTQADQLLWSRDERWLFLRAPRSLTIVGIDGHAGVRVPMGGKEQRQLIKLDPSQPAAVLLRERVRVDAGERWRIVRMDAGGRRTVLREDARWIHDVALDATGRVVAMVRFEGDHDALQRVLPDGSLREALRLRPMQRVDLLATLADGSLLLEGNPGGDADAGNFRRLLRLDADDTLQTLHQDPRGEADLDEVALDPRSQLPVAASYRSTVAATWGIGAAKAMVADIGRKFPGRDIGLQVASGPAAHWLISESAATLRDPRWYLYDTRNGEVRRILDDAGLVANVPAEVALARKLAIRYTASDGMRVHGFVLLPPGVDAARAPLIAQVHGGPISHFRSGYDGMAQFLANRGYVVFQSNFRGSTGHGLVYTFASKGDYGNGRVQQDIVEGVRWLLARGIGDADRVGIVGHSFGGYSTLLGLTFQPELFKVGVAAAAPADFGWNMQWLVASGDQGDLPDRSLLQTLKALSVDPGDQVSRAQLRVQSPQANAARMQRPLLLMAGGADRTVPIRSITHYAATLQSLHQPVTLLVEPGGAHSPVDIVPREAYLFATETMLQRHLGGDSPEPPGQRLRAYLRENLRLAGQEFSKFAAKSN